jgi:hypothetical protein
MTDDRWIASFHESSHLVAAITLGNVVAGARITPNGGGWTRQGPPPGLDLREARRRRAIVAVCAPLACQMEFGPAGLRGCNTDELTCRTLIHDYGLDRDEVLATARAIVESNIRLIRRLAFQLFLRNEIDGAVISEVLRRLPVPARRAKAAA